VRIAATVSSDEEAASFDAFLDRYEVAAKDRVIRRIALRGAAEIGVPLARADLIPEITITANGVYWHPVGADDNDFFVTAEIFHLAEAFAAVRLAFDEERRHAAHLPRIFNCASACSSLPPLTNASLCCQWRHRAQVTTMPSTTIRRPGRGRVPDGVP
jgi:hypothetical protein